MLASLDIVIVNWNSGSQLRACLNSIRASARDGFTLSRVVIVDNASADDSANELLYPELPLRVIYSSINLGFAAACNRGAHGTCAEYLLFLNPDTILESQSLRAAISFMETPNNSRIGVCGIQLLDERGQVVRSCSRFPEPGHFYAHVFGLNRLFPSRFRNNFMNDWDHGATTRVDVVTGAFLLVRRSIFQSVGGFDERFFVYLEDVDFLQAAHRAGWECHYLVDAHAYHKGGGCSENAKAERIFYSLRSRILYSYKHFSRAAATGILASTLIIEPFTRLAFAAMQASASATRETLEAYRMLWRGLPALRRAEVTNSQQKPAAPQPLHSDSVN
jgi:N-acetylglucosaminyl-diphospho-decaprenol L-rhamnosyltransferase